MLLCSLYWDCPQCAFLLAALVVCICAVVFRADVCTSVLVELSPQEHVLLLFCNNVLLIAL